MMPYTMISPMLMPMRSATEARRCPAEALDDHGIGQRANVRIHQQTSGCVGARAGRGSGGEGDLGVDGVWFRVTLRFGTPSIAEVLRPDFAMTEQ
jgi:hypothetical protein